jgi:large subunit ribosomal protein L13
VDALSYKTRSVPEGTLQREWFIVDAENQTLGRMVTRIASVLRGKHKPSFTPNADCGDFVIVVNAEKVRMTGKKMDDRELIHYTGFPGGQRFRTPRSIVEKDARKLIEHAVKGMLPKNSLGRRMFKKLFVYNGEAHPHSAQKPKAL